MTMVVDTALYRYLALASALSIEIRTGMRHSRGSVVKQVNAITGGQARRKVQALLDITLYTMILYPQYRPNDRITEILGGPEYVATVIEHAEKVRAEILASEPTE